MPGRTSSQRGRQRTAVQGAGGGAERLVRVEQDILADNDRLAARNRAFFLERKILGLNLMSGPRSGQDNAAGANHRRLAGRRADLRYRR